MESPTKDISTTQPESAPAAEPAKPVNPKQMLIEAQKQRKLHQQQLAVLRQKATKGDLYQSMQVVGNQIHQSVMARFAEHDNLFAFLIEEKKLFTMDEYNAWYDQKQKEYAAQQEAHKALSPPEPEVEHLHAPHSS